MLIFYFIRNSSPSVSKCSTNSVTFTMHLALLKWFLSHGIFVISLNIHFFVFRFLHLRMSLTSHSKSPPTRSGVGLMTSLWYGDKLYSLNGFSNEKWNVKCTLISGSNFNLYMSLNTQSSIGWKLYSHVPFFNLFGNGRSCWILVSLQPS